jgi:uncharacterized protein with FMN-binding domain
LYETPSANLVEGVFNWLVFINGINYIHEVKLNLQERLFLNMKNSAKFSEAGGTNMKKLLGLLIASVVALPLSACAVRDNNRNMVQNDGGTGVRRLTQQNGYYDNAVGYRDGVYTGYGNNYTGGNEMATVTIRNGRIVDVDLTNVNQQRGANNIMGTRTGTGANDRATWPGYGWAPDNTGNYGMGTGTDNRFGSKNRILTGDTGGIIGGTNNNEMSAVRTRLTNAVIREQRYDVTIVNNDNTIVAPINNWKLAVQRALDQARR